MLRVQLYITVPESSGNGGIRALNSRPPFDVTALVREELFLALTMDVGENLKGNFFLANVVEDPHLKVTREGNERSSERKLFIGDRESGTTRNENFITIPVSLKEN